MPGACMSSFLVILQVRLFREIYNMYFFKWRNKSKHYGEEAVPGWTTQQI
jgi:hypothetical protein